jgi:hypothetical protein
MTLSSAPDQVRHNLERLPPLLPDPARASQVRARCRAQLAHSQRRSERTALIVGFGRRVLAPGIVLGLCAFYVASLLSAALRLRNLI